MVQAHHHRPTGLKQQNKPFKSKHSTKSALKDAAKGRIPGQARKSPKLTNASSAAAQARLARKNKAKQTQANKRASLLSAARLFNGVDGTPRIVALVPLTPDVSACDVAESLTKILDLQMDSIPDAGLFKIKAERFKTSLQFINLQYKSFYDCLDACKIADYVVFILSPVVEVDQWGDTLLRTLQAQGLPDVLTVIPANSDLQDLKSRAGTLKSLLSFTQYFVPTQKRVFDLSSSSDGLNLLRALSEGAPSSVRWREGRSYLLAESSTWQDGTLSVTGVIRGSSLSPNRLVHIPNFGDFQISRIFSAPLPKSPKGSHAPVDMEIEPSLLAEPDPSSADSLVSTNVPDDMANEQTWPTEDEMRGLDASTSDLPDVPPTTTPKSIKRVPKGMSEYQASWIVDESDDDDDGDEPHDDDEATEAEEMETIEEPEAQPDHDDEMESQSVMFNELDEEEEAAQLKKWRDRNREEKDDLEFPDEIDTPQGVTAQTRFQRYRGLQSFRTSPWDPYENLPRDYARIFQFEDYKRTERNVRRRAEEDVSALGVGTRVTVCLKEVPREAATVVPLALFTLLQHEHKISVLHFTVQRNTEYDGSVRSKDPLILCIGARRLRVNPIYSQHTRGGGKGANNVHKFERYLRHGHTSVATVYGPVVFGKQPCLMLRETADSEAPQLVASGSFMDPDTTRIIAKRLILTGHPFKVHKKTATVRYMFFNADDIQYFKPIQLTTKHGRTGHIRESLGTHGYFKAHFDGPISQMDTICMALYKRVYPKWATLWEGSGRSKLAVDTMQE